MGWGVRWEFNVSLCACVRACVCVCVCVCFMCHVLCTGLCRLQIGFHLVEFICEMFSGYFSFFFCRRCLISQVKYLLLQGVGLGDEEGNQL